MPERSAPAPMAAIQGLITSGRGHRRLEGFDAQDGLSRASAGLLASGRHYRLGDTIVWATLASGRYCPLGLKVPGIACPGGGASPGSPHGGNQRLGASGPEDLEEPGEGLPL